jgi:hypothetical protein
VAPQIIVLSRHIIHNEGYLQIYICVIFLETRHHAQAHFTSGTLIDCALSLATRRTDGSRVVLMILLASACYGDSQVAKQFLSLNLVFKPIWGWGDLGSFQLPQSNSLPGGA